MIYVFYCRFNNNGSNRVASGDPEAGNRAAREEEPSAAEVWMVMGLQMAMGLREAPIQAQKVTGIGVILLKTVSVGG